jgi:hypothetical protein
VKKSKLNPLKWIAILPQLAELVGSVVDALKDGRLDGAEIERIGGELAAIVAAVVDHD